METQFILLDQPGYRLPSSVQEKVQEFLKLSEYTTDEFLKLKRAMDEEVIPMNGRAFTFAASMAMNLLKNTALESPDYRPLSSGLKSLNVMIVGFSLLIGRAKSRPLEQGEHSCNYCGSTYNGNRCSSCGAPHRYKLNLANL